MTPDAAPPVPEPSSEQPVLTMHRGLAPEVMNQVLTAVEAALDGVGAQRIRIAPEGRDLTVMATFPPAGSVARRPDDDSAATTDDRR